MTYSICALYKSSESTLSYGYSYLIGDEDWTCRNYWYDLGDEVAHVIELAEGNLSKLFPEGHTYALDNIHIELIGDDD